MNIFLTAFFCQRLNRILTFLCYIPNTISCAFVSISTDEKTVYAMCWDIPLTPPPFI